MGLRFYICPVVGDGVSTTTAFRPKLSGLAGVLGQAAIIPHGVDGKPTFTWCIVVARATDWSVVNADATLARLFGVDLPDTIDTMADLKAYLMAHTVGDIPAARRTAMNNRMTAVGLDTSQVALSTTWWQVVLGIYQQMGMSAESGDGFSI